MSVIGATNVAGMNLAGSAAGAQRNNSAEGEAKSAAADRKFSMDQRQMSAQALSDVAQSDRSADRDADGRLLASYSGDEQDADPSADDGRQSKRDSVGSSDPYDVRGTQLDLTV